MAIALPEWPVSLPTFGTDGMAEAEADLFIRSNVDKSIAKQRLVSSAGPRPLSGQIMMTREQYEIFIRFYHQRLNRGILRFKFPRTMFPEDSNEMMEVRLTAPPSYVRPSSNLVLVRLEMEELP